MTKKLNDFLKVSWFDFDHMTFIPENMTSRTRATFENHLAKMRLIDKHISIIMNPISSEKQKEASYIALVKMLHFTHHRDTENRKSKLDGLTSISTCALVNHYCMARKLEAMLHPEKDIICKYCYAITQQRQQIGTMLCGIRNKKILSSVLIPVEYFKYADVGEDENQRIEAFGDVDCETQCRNFIRLVKAWTVKNFAGWSKNIMIWFSSFEKEGKPINLCFVVSSLIVNVVMPIKECFMKWIDHRFTVFDHDFAKAHNIKINCGGRKCIKCLLCYRHNTEFDIYELKK